MTHPSPSPSPADSSESDDLPGGDSNFIGNYIVVLNSKENITNKMT